MFATTQPPVPRCYPACPQQVIALCIAKHSVSSHIASAREHAPQRLQGRQVVARAQKQKKAQRKRTRQPEHSGGDEAACTETSREPSRQPSADRQQPTSTSGKPIGWSFLPREDERWQPNEEPATAPPQVCAIAVATVRASSCTCHHSSATIMSELCKHCQQHGREVPTRVSTARSGLQGCSQGGVESACLSQTHPTHQSRPRTHGPGGAGSGGGPGRRRRRRAEEYLGTGV